MDSRQVWWNSPGHLRCLVSFLSHSYLIKPIILNCLLSPNYKSWNPILHTCPMKTCLKLDYYLKTWKAYTKMVHTRLCFYSGCWGHFINGIWSLLPRSGSGLVLKNLPANAGDPGSILGWGDPLEKEMTTHSSILAREILWTRGAWGLQFMGWQKSHTWLSD